MPDLPVTVAVVALIALVEATPFIRLPLGLLLAIALLASGAEVLPIALLGAAGVMLARSWLAAAARRGRDRLGGSSANAQAQREALRRHLAGSSTYARTTFVLAALPGVPPGFIFPLLGAMRAPLWPALAGTLVGRTPILALTTAVFAWLGRFGSDSDAEGALVLGIMAVLLLVFRTLGLIDWKHRAETGTFRLRDPDEQAIRMTTMFGSGTTPGTADPFDALPRDPAQSDDEDVLEGEVLGEDDEDDDSDDAPPPALPPTGLAPS